MIYRFGDYELDTNLYTLQRGRQTTRLRLKVFRMCLYLLEHRDRVVSRDELCAQIWPGQIVSQATLEGVIRLVRQAVGDSGRTQSVIQTLHGHGYRFVAPVDESTLADRAGEGARAVAMPRTVGVPVLPEYVEIANNSNDSTEHMEKEELEASLGAEQGSSATHWHSADRPELRHFDDQCSRLRPGSGRRWLPRLGLALAFITLVVMGGWAVSWALRGQSAGRLDKSRIAVLPFVDLSAEADQNAIADGLTENLIAELARSQGLTVIARTSVIKYKGSLKDVATIGHELQVGSIIEGSVRRIDNQVRISAQLIDVASQSHLWSEEYERELSEVFGAKSEIATRVVQWLKGQVPPGSVTDCLRAEPQPTALVQNMRGSQ